MQLEHRSRSSPPTVRMSTVIGDATCRCAGTVLPGHKRNPTTAHATQIHAALCYRRLILRRVKVLAHRVVVECRPPLCGAGGDRGQRTAGAVEEFSNSASLLSTVLSHSPVRLACRVDEAGRFRWPPQPPRSRYQALLLLMPLLHGFLS